MPTLKSRVQAFAELLSVGRVVESIERYYAEEVCVFENRTLARAGRAQCVAYERAALEKVSGPLHFKIHKIAVDEESGAAFLEYTLRFTPRDGRPSRLDEVAVQQWEGGKITSERFYYEGIVDEGNDDP